MTQALEGFLQALSAGLLIGAIYGLMCVGLGLIFGVMRVINFAQGDFMMLGMYAAFYFFTALGVQTAFGNTFGPFVAILLAGPVLAVFGYFVHLTLISRVSGMRTSSLEGEGHYAQLILTLGIAHPAKWRLAGVWLGIGLDPDAAVEFSMGDRTAAL